MTHCLQAPGTCSLKQRVKRSTWPFFTFCTYCQSTWCPNRSEPLPGCLYKRPRFLYYFTPFYLVRGQTLEALVHPTKPFWWGIKGRKLNSGHPWSQIWKHLFLDFSGPCFLWSIFDPIYIWQCLFVIIFDINTSSTHQQHIWVTLHSFLTEYHHPLA